MTTYSLDAGFNAPGIQFLDAFGNPMAAGVRVRLYPQFAQIIDANVVAQDWSRPGGICPSLNPPAGTYWAYFRGRQGPELPVLVTIPPSASAPQLGLQGSLEATLFHGNPPQDASLSPAATLAEEYISGGGGGFLHMVGAPHGPLVFATDTVANTVVQIDTATCMVTVAGSIGAYGSINIASGSLVSIGTVGYEPGFLSNQANNGLLTISNGATVLDNLGDLFADGLIDGATTVVICGVAATVSGASSDNSFISWGGAGYTPLVCDTGGRIEVSHSAFIENGNVSQPSWQQTLRVHNNAGLLVSGDAFGVSDNAWFEMLGNGDSCVLDHGGQMQVLGESFVSVNSTTNVSANYKATITVDGSGSLLRTHDQSSINFCNSNSSHSTTLYDGAIAVTAGGVYEAHGEAALWLGNNGTGTNGGSSNSVNGTGSLNVTANFQHSDGNLWIGGVLNVNSDLTLANFEKIQVNTGNNLPFFTAAQGSGHTMNFSSSVLLNSGTVSSYAWNFGDAGTSTSANPSHTYASAGTYRVVLTVTDSLGNVSDCAVQVVVT